MLLLAALMAAAAWSYGFAQEIPVQTPISITKFQKSARMTCEIQSLGANFDGTVIHWYQQKEGKAPQRFLFFSGGKPTVDSGFQANRFMVENVSGQKRCVLTIKDVIPDDAATYYCAYWDEYYKVFGTGTKLIVSGKGNSAPTNSEILQKTQHNQITYVCLIEKFYPEVIRVTWTDGDQKEVTDNVVKGGPWKSPKEEAYSISSWLTVPAENKDKNYYCKYEHESQQHSLPTRDSTATAPQEEDCSTYPGNSAVFNRDHLMHRTAYLVYIVLLLKSSMYYIIVVFFIYRTWAPIKQQRKKA
ncbi:PREDICTED: Ig heavy chain Mem5-like [Leptosomus discolor]|uniref:Ig heavy chain Mem5-like n=1 Tax=Leptosomus discolor TaxID=188344 RepID=UPI000522AE4C|nr:PREDICTED: Ig heavy chain Mem5-like [Leptosomus discolor]